MVSQEDKRGVGFEIDHLHTTAEWSDCDADKQIQKKGFGLEYELKISQGQSPEHSFLSEGNRNSILDEPLDFTAEDEPEDYFKRSASEITKGSFVKLENLSHSNLNDEEGRWELEISPVQIKGEGINSHLTNEPAQNAEHDFLAVGTRGRQSAKHVPAQGGTRVSIDSVTCKVWATNVVAKGWFSSEDIKSLVVYCEGNSELEELQLNVQRTLEVAGLTFVDGAFEYEAEVWDAKSDVTPDELAEAVDSVLTRATRLPGTQRFRMDRSVELQILKPLVQAKQQLHLGILDCPTAVEFILDTLNSVRDGIIDLASVSLRSINPSQLEEAETAEFYLAIESLKYWHLNGRVMEGKRRREALTDLEALDLTPRFFKSIVAAIEELEGGLYDAIRLNSLILMFEATTEHLICEHLPYARRFAWRNVEEGEDPEDAFQVAYMGLQRSTRRFDLDRGVRFAGYSAFWINQAIRRWRADEGAAIRIPVHRHENLAKFDQAIDKLDIEATGVVSDCDLALELDWSIEEVRQFRSIPRKAEYPQSIAMWENLLPAPTVESAFDHEELQEALSSVLATLHPREERVIRKRFGIGMNNEYTLEEVGIEFSVTRERIRQIEAKALKNLRGPSRSRILRPFLAGTSGEET